MQIAHITNEMEITNCSAMSTYLKVLPFVVVPTVPFIASAGGNEVM